MNREIWIGGRPPKPVPQQKPALATNCHKDIEVLASDFGQVLAAVLQKHEDMAEKAIELMNRLFNLLEELVARNHIGYIIIDEFMCDMRGDFTFHYILYG
jgi:hypothetical protein